MIAILLLCFCFSGVEDQSWGQFRNGGKPWGEPASLPTTWSPKTKFSWEVELEGYGQSSPVHWNGTVVVSQVVGARKETCLVQAFEIASGKERWKFELPATSPRLASNYSVARAAPTPIIDESGVYAFFEAGDLFCLDHAGKLRWHRRLTKDIGEFDNHHGLGSSPVASVEAIFLNIEHRGPSCLLCIDKKTGETTWKQERKSGMSWTSPIVSTVDGKELVIVSSAGTADGYDAKTGEKQWTFSGLSGNTVPSPTLVGNELFLGAAHSDFEAAENAAKSNICLQLTGKGQTLKWRSEKAMCDYASPVVTDKFVYYVNRVGILFCLDRETGKQLFAERLSGSVWSTPFVHRDHLYVTAKDGLTTIFAIAPMQTVIARNHLWDTSNPPKPKTYVEAPGGNSHDESGITKSGSSTAKEGKATTDGAAAKKKRGGAGGGFAGMLLQNDKNKDGKITKDELPEAMLRMLALGDKNKDDALDQSEIAAMSEEFRKRRENSATESRDPILYAAIPASGRLIFRTGTHLYVVQNDNLVATGN